MHDRAKIDPAGDPRPRRAVTPAWVHDGLAVYSLGIGPPLLLMPNPQGMVHAPEACRPLADLLVGLGRRVITFDPPGSFASPRLPRLGLEEMLACSHQALQVAGVAPPVDVVGHSQATLCQLALALTVPEAVRSLVLVGAVDGGWRATRRAAGMPWCWPITDPRRWRFAWLGAPLAAGQGNLGRLKRLQQLYTQASFVNLCLAPAIHVQPGDQRRPPRSERAGRPASAMSTCGLTSARLGSNPGVCRPPRPADPLAEQRRHRRRAPGRAPEELRGLRPLPAPGGTRPLHRRHQGVPLRSAPEPGTSLSTVVRPTGDRRPTVVRHGRSSAGRSGRSSS